MTNSSLTSIDIHASEAFRSSATKPHDEGKRPKSVKPFSLRLTEDERDYLRKSAAGQPLGAYIRARFEISLGISVACASPLLP